MRAAQESNMMTIQQGFIWLPVTLFTALILDWTFSRPVLSDRHQKTLKNNIGSDLLQEDVYGAWSTDRVLF